jgi:DNA (cytosine-5)-methyltransferase 1
MRRVTMGNFFSGSGTWELAAKICGIDVLFESEIEKFPIELEAKRFPEAIQLGDIAKVDGRTIPIPDILTNSSPCQDLSVAGLRKGLDGERSGLFREVIRITKEMQERYGEVAGDTDESVRHVRFWCWENVPGALSSGKNYKGEDFEIVLKEVISLIDEEAPDLYVPKEGWHNSGVVDLDRGQIAWRVMDAQFYGVAQRRRRLFLVADLAGHSAAEVLFERKSVSWHFEEIRKTWETTSRSIEDRIRTAGRIVCGE